MIIARESCMCGVNTSQVLLSCSEALIKRGTYNILDIRALTSLFLN
jgi:hypothetical protein